jgi:3-hydroxyisobutyrate dehydrogenase-like beta-hydroxyacid dehydrogenase
MQRIGIIGLGLLGSAVAARLLQRGFDVSGYDIRAEQVAALGRQGLRPATSIAAVAQEADAIFTILPTLESVEAVFCGPGGLIDTAPRHAILMQMSTISPALTQRLAERVAARGRRFLDTPISGTSAMVAQGDCTLLVGGTAATAQTCRPIFDAIARRTVHVGDIGMASLAKLVTNLLVALNTAALAEALVLAAKGGLAPATMLDALSDSAASSRMLDVRGPLMVAGEFPPQMKLDLFLKDLRLMLEEGQRLAVPLPLTSTAQELYAAAAAAGAGSEDLAVVMRRLEQLAGLSPSPR